MSEYQYYEFQTIDKPLTKAQREHVQSFSSRARVSSSKASFVYNYGDFRGDERALLGECFDIMLYITNWGSRHLRFRFPRDLLDTKHIAPFCISESIDHFKTEDGKFIILELIFNDDGGSDWLEGDQFLDELAPLREELLHGDFRVLYLAWLRAAQEALESEDIDEDTLEPPVPRGLNNLTPAQREFCQFIELDDELLEVGAENSVELDDRRTDLSSFVTALSESEKTDFLVKIARDEVNAAVQLKKKLKVLANDGCGEGSDGVMDLRRVGDICGVLV